MSDQNSGRAGEPLGGTRIKVLSLTYWERFIKFNAVGLSGVAVNEIALAVLAFLGLYYLYADAVAIEISIVSNFVFNDIWTFKDRRHGHIVARFVKFNALMLLGLAVNLAVVFVGTDRFGIHPLLSNLIGIAVAFLLRYFLSVKYTWAHVEDPEGQRRT